MKTRNPTRLKILSIVSIFLIIGLQYFVYQRNRHAVLFGKNLVTTRGKITDHHPFENIYVEYFDIRSGKRIQTSKKIGKKYDPFIGIEHHENLSITYDKEDHLLFFIDGYEDKPSSFLFYFTLFMGLVAQILLFGVIVDFLDNDLHKL